MNAERLHALADKLRAELDLGSPQALNELVEAVRNSVQDPSNAGHQQAASDSRRRVGEILADAPSNSFSPALRQSLEEMGIAHLLGEALQEHVEEILARNEITPSAAAEELSPIAEELLNLDAGVNQLRTGLEQFNIGAEELDPGEFEIGFLVPRREVDNNLKQLGKEFKELDGILGPFLEISTGARPNVPVRSISSSDFQVLLDSLPATAALLMTAVERLISAYDKILNIRLARQQLAENSASQETLESAAKDAEGMMKEEIEGLADTLVEDVSNQGRANELRIEIRRSLNALANRIDAGYSIEVRAGELPEPEVEVDDEGEATETDKYAEVRKIVEEVLAGQRRLEFRNLTGEPILQLPEEANDNGDDAEGN